jgi:hypothetical protein
MSDAVLIDRLIEAAEDHLRSRVPALRAEVHRRLAAPHGPVSGRPADPAAKPWVTISRWDAELAIEACAIADDSRPFSGWDELKERLTDAVTGAGRAGDAALLGPVSRQ